MKSAFEEALAGNHVETIKAAIGILARRFCDGDGFEGYQKDGPVAAVRFEGADAGDADRQILRQRDLSAVVQDAITPFI